MTRQVDIRSLISHIVNGDGMDKCRICLGETSEGQVHLGDTVMMDGDKPLTLSEVLETVTGVEVETEEAIPSAICITCSTSCMQAYEFRTLVHDSNQHWTNSLQLLECLPDHQYSKNNDRIIAIVSNNKLTITEHCTQPKPKPISIENCNGYRRFGKQESCQCPMCGMNFSYAQHLYQHLKESADMVRACHICAEIMTRNQLVTHLVGEHNVRPYPCKKCPALYLHVNQYKEHVSSAHAPGACTCGDCGRSFQSSPAFNAHLSIHSNRSCPNCDKQFRNQKCYYYHVKTCCNLDAKNVKKKAKVTVTLKNKNNTKVSIGKRGSTIKKCICDYCNKVFSGKKFIAAHIKIVHTKDTHRPCTYCGKVFAAAHMSTHMKSHSDHLFECHQCGIRLKSKLGFSQHLRLHTGERPYPCQYCGESFSASSRRSAHIRSAHKKTDIINKHACKLCPARFKLPFKLKHHMKSVHGEGTEDKAWYECNVCREKFASCRSLLHHTRKHCK